MDSKKPLFKGKHKALINIYLEEFIKNSTFDSSQLDKMLLNAISIAMSNKLNLYLRKIIENELEVINDSLEIKISYEEFIVLDKPYLIMIGKYECVSALVNELFYDLKLTFEQTKIYCHESENDLIDNGFIENLDSVTQVFFLTGETHDNNKNVLVFYVNKKPIFCLKYRSMKTEKLTIEFIEKYMLDEFSYKKWESAKVIDKGEYGWVKWISKYNFKDKCEVEEYYKKMGHLLGLCSMMNITDLHFENIIAASNPAIIDFETVMETNFIHSIPSGFIKTALLPHTIKYRYGIAEIEHSGIGNFFDASLNDGDSERTNVVKLNDIVQYSYEYKEILINAAKESLENIEKNKLVFMNFFEMLKENEHRVLLKSTATYDQIIEASMHPALMRSNEKRAGYILKCLQIDNELNLPDHILSEEKNNCSKGDVPRFISNINSTTIWNINGFSGNLPVEIANGYDYCTNHMENLNEEYIRSEIKLLETLFDSTERIALSNSSITGKNENTVADINNFFQLTRDKISRDAYSMFEGDYQYFPFYENCLDFRKPPLDLFTGLGGFLYTDSLMNGEHSLLCTPDIQKSFAICIKIIREKRNISLGGAYIGDLSAFVPLVSNYHLCADFLKIELRLYGEVLLEHIKDANFNWQGGYGLVSGLSGSLVLTSMYFHLTQDKVWQDISHLLFNMLKKGGINKHDSLIFDAGKISLHESGALCGLSHGQSGIAYAIAVYGVLNQNFKIECEKLICNILNFEFRQYSSIDFNWPDLRLPIPNQEASHDFSWAHGGAGILLSIDFISRNYCIAQIKDFYRDHCIEEIFNFNLLRDVERANFSISNGPLGALLIYRHLFNKHHPNENVIVNIKDNLVTAFTGLGLLKGVAGEFLALNEFCKEGNRLKFPLLPHLLFTNMES